MRVSSCRPLCHAAAAWLPPFLPIAAASLTAARSSAHPRCRYLAYNNLTGTVPSSWLQLPSLNLVQVQPGNSDLCTSSLPSSARFDLCPVGYVICSAESLTPDGPQCSASSSGGSGSESEADEAAAGAHRRSALASSPAAAVVRLRAFARKVATPPFLAVLAGAAAGMTPLGETRVALGVGRAYN